MELTHQEYTTLKEIVGRYESKSNNSNYLLSKKVLDTTLYDMDISVRLFHVMKHGMGIKTIRDMVQLSVNDFTRQRNFGKRCLEELKELYDHYGLQFVEK